ncbi:hypothetical protein LOTGIDRAFT_156778 [Lottia gigantea]|uniref:EF-hand domain-containing protein n=1 Tax=Lottia gigantea TaxID=225164 RepID=V4AFN9_LOTGI|nr:hypothetical protein LOTGIDRAFT_156778 [Lottia gigantea]ESP02829.1 hypothetical protein LOTGIDRAFT_156778 [Lottia gigantea]
MASEDDDLCYEIYFDQLKEVFNGCDDDNKGYLTQSQLRTLCDKLELEEKHNFLLAQLETENCIDKIYFDNFKGAFLNSLKENSNETNNSPSGISPKFVLGGKKYGRRTRPECEKDHDVLDESILEKSNKQCLTNSLLLKPSNRHNLSSSSIIDQGKRLLGVNPD